MVTRVAEVKSEVATKGGSHGDGGIEKEVMLDVAPETLLKGEEGVEWNNPATASMRARFERMIFAAQDSICKAVEEVDGKKFRQDSWVRSANGNVAHLIRA